MNHDIGVRGGDGGVWRSKGRFSLTKGYTRYDHIDANIFGFSHLVVAVDKSQLMSLAPRHTKARNQV